MWGWCIPWFSLLSGSAVNCLVMGGEGLQRYSSNVGGVWVLGGLLPFDP